MICSWCSRDETLVEFSRRMRKRLPIEVRCRSCAEYPTRAHLLAADSTSPDDTISERKLREFLREIKATTACQDCRRTYPHFVMDFDHLGGKLANVGHLVRFRSVRLIINELAKCEVVCSNCHRLRTWQRQQAAKLTLALPA